MKKYSFVLVGLIAILCVINSGLLCQSSRFKEIASEEQSSRQRVEWTVLDAMKNIGKRVPLDSISLGHHFILRYDATSCMLCVLDAEALLESVFGRDEIYKELCIIGISDSASPLNNGIAATTYEGTLTPMDEIYSPYFCYINDNGDILFSLALQPENYDYNHEFLTRLKEVLKGI